MRTGWGLLLVGAIFIVVTACAPDALDQPQSGDGWRLIGWTRGGDLSPPAAGDEALELLSALGLRRMGGAVTPTAGSEVDVVVTHAVSGSCPRVRFDGFTFGDDAVVANITDHDDLVTLEAAECTADANPVVFWLAVQRSRLPEEPFELLTDEAPGVRIPVDLGD